MNYEKRRNWKERKQRRSRVRKRIGKGMDGWIDDRLKYNSLLIHPC